MEFAGDPGASLILPMRSILACAALASLCALLIAATACMVVIASAVERIPAKIDAAVVETRSALLGEVTATREELLKRVDALGLKADSRLDRIEGELNAQINHTLALADEKLAGTLAVANLALAEVHGLREDVAPILAHSSSIVRQVDEALPLFADCDHNADCAFNRFQGTSKAVEKAAQNFGAMSAEIRADLPHTLAGVDRIVANSDKTSAASAKLMTNLAEASKPLPRWLRIPLAISGALAPTISGALAGAAATGAFR